MLCGMSGCARRGGCPAELERKRVRRCQSVECPRSPRRLRQLCPRLPHPLHGGGDSSPVLFQFRQGLLKIQGLVCLLLLFHSGAMGAKRIIPIRGDDRFSMPRTEARWGNALHPLGSRRTLGRLTLTSVRLRRWCCPSGLQRGWRYCHSNTRSNTALRNRASLLLRLWKCLCSTHPSSFRSLAGFPAGRSPRRIKVPTRSLESPLLLQLRTASLCSCKLLAFPLLHWLLWTALLTTAAAAAAATAATSTCFSPSALLLLLL